MAGGLGVATGGGSGDINALLHSGAWYKNTRIIKLNLWILLLLITSSTNGYDGVSKNFFWAAGRRYLFVIRPATRNWSRITH